MPTLRTLLLCLLFASLAAPLRAEEPSEDEPSDDEPSQVQPSQVQPSQEEPVAERITGRNCLGEPAPKAVLHSLIGIKYGDWGLEHQLRIGACVPLWKKKGVLFDLSVFEAGFVMHTTPIYVMPGAYFRFAPLSILALVVEAAPIFYWPIGLSSAGYYPIENYRSDYTKASLLAEDGGTALGWYVRAGPNLQLAVPLGSARLIVVNTFRVEHFRIGDAPFYFHNRNDLPAARDEWFIDNTAIVMVEFALSRNTNLRLGANDQLTMNLGGPSISNAVRGVAMLHVKKLGLRIRDFTPILAVGGRTDHPMRKGDFNFIVALSFSADLSAKKPSS